MNRLRRRTLLLLSLPALRSLRAQLVQCPSCGREARPGDPRCRGCRTELGPRNPAPAEAPPAAAPEVADPEDTAAPLDLAPALQDAGDARKALEAGQPRLAVLFAQHALALHALSREKKPELVREMRALVRAAEQGQGNRPVDCPVCAGTGEREDLVLTMKGEGKTLRGPGLLCPACKGAKRLPGIASEETLLAELAKARPSFIARQENGGRAHPEHAWLPRELDPASLAPRSIARFRREITGSCHVCLGLGRQACAECAGTGVRDCPDRDCVFGRVICPECDGKKMEPVQVGAQTALRPCRTCNSRGIAPCETCGGKAFLVCGRCEGQKGRICRDCQGSGQIRDCARCRGEGLVACSRCRGTGESRGKPCDSCQGRREILCNSCAGAGRRQG